MIKYGKIYLAWRKGRGFARHIVGEIKSDSEGISFKYLANEELTKAQEDGFTNYTEFPNLEKIYTENVVEVFKQRLTKSERGDYDRFLSFWNIEQKKKEDTLYLLALTQGLVPTDNFEFLADFHVTKELRIVSELTGLTNNPIDASAVKVDDMLTFEKAPSEHDNKQVNLYTEGRQLVGCVKKIHSRIFYKRRSEFLKVRVKAIEKNGVLKRAFIEIYQ